MRNKVPQEERLQLARQLLQQRDAMLRNALQPVDWLAFRLGCTLAEAEKLVARIKEEQQ